MVLYGIGYTPPLWCPPTNPPPATLCLSCKEVLLATRDISVHAPSAAQGPLRWGSPDLGSAGLLTAMRSSCPGLGLTRGKVGLGAPPSLLSWGPLVEDAEIG